MESSKLKKIDSPEKLIKIKKDIKKRYKKLFNAKDRIDYTPKNIDKVIYTLNQKNKELKEFFQKNNLSMDEIQRTNLTNSPLAKPKKLGSKVKPKKLFIETVDYNDVASINSPKKHLSAGPSPKAVSTSSQENASQINELLKQCTKLEKRKLSLPRISFSRSSKLIDNLDTFQAAVRNFKTQREIRNFLKAEAKNNKIQGRLMEDCKEIHRNKDSIQRFLLKGSEVVRMKKKYTVD